MLQQYTLAFNMWLHLEKSTLNAIASLHHYILYLDDLYCIIVHGFEKMEKETKMDAEGCCMLLS